MAENVPVVRRGRAMGAYLAGHSLGLALALALTGAAIPRGGYVLAFWLLALGPLAGGAVAWLAVRTTANVVAPRAGGARFTGAVLRNRPAAEGRNRARPPTMEKVPPSVPVWLVSVFTWPGSGS